MMDDSPDRPDGPFDPYPEDPAVPSEGSLPGQTVYTSPDGAMYIPGILQLKLLNEHGTEDNIWIPILVAPVHMADFNIWSHSGRNSVFLEAKIIPD